MLRIIGLAEDGVEARHQMESPKIRTPDEYEACSVLWKSLAPNGRHAAHVIHVLEVGDDRVVDELERRHPLSVVFRRGGMEILFTFGKRTELEVSRDDGDSLLKKVDFDEFDLNTSSLSAAI